MNQHNLVFDIKDIPWLELLVNFLGIVVGALIAIIVFWLGKRSENRKEENRLKEVELYIQKAIPELCKVIQKQIEYLRGFSNELIRDKEAHYTYDSAVALHSKTIRWINHYDLFKIFITRKGGDVDTKSRFFAEFNSQLDYIDSVTGNLDRLVQGYFLKRYESLIKKWNLNITYIRDLRDELLVEYQVAHELDTRAKLTEFLARFNTIFSEWVLVEDFREHKIAKEKFLIPLRRACDDHQTAKHSRLVLQTIVDCETAYTNLLLLKAFVKEHVDFMEKSLVNSKEKFESTMKYFLSI